MNEISSGPMVASTTLRTGQRRGHQALTPRRPRGALPDFLHGDLWRLDDPASPQTPSRCGDQHTHARIHTSHRASAVPLVGPNFVVEPLLGPNFAAWLVE